MAYKLKSGEDRTGQVWYPYGFDPAAESFVVTGPPHVDRAGHKRRLAPLSHPVLHLSSGRTSWRDERSLAWWIRAYVRVL